MSNKRSLGDVYAALEAERVSRGLPVLALAVGFEDRTEFVFAGEEEGLRKLKWHLMTGGEPIGTLALDRHGAVEVNPLPEFETESWAFDYLSDLTAIFMRTLKARVVATVERGDH